jgi:hypothetical protein
MYSEEFLKKITGVGSLGYSYQKTINVLDIENLDTFKKDFFDENSEVYKYYRKGMDIADYAIDQKLFEKAKSGDLKALDEYERRRDFEQSIFEEEKRKI